MVFDNAERQARHRARIRDQLRLRTEALEAILAALDGNTKPLAAKLRAIAEDGLK